MTKIFVLLLTLAAALLFGQDKVKSTSNRLAVQQAWSMVNINLPDNTPAVSGGGLVPETQPNNQEKKVWAVFTKPGTYLLQGVPCDGSEPIRLGERLLENNENALQLVLDTEAMISAAPLFGRFCSVNMIRIGAGILERSSVNVDIWAEEPEKLQVLNESVNGEEYVLSVGFIQPDAIVIFGRSLIGEIRPTLNGPRIYFKGYQLNLRGPATLTLCTKDGKCRSTTYEKKMVVVNNEKG